MRRRLNQWTLCRTTLVAALWLAGSFVWAQQSCLTPTVPNCRPAPGIVPVPMPGTVPSMPGAEPLLPPEGSGMGSSATPNSAGSAMFADLASGADVGSSVALAAPGGYLDSAIPKSMIRLRYDAGFDMNRPDRAEYFYATWRELSFHPHGINGHGVFFDPKARGPVQLPGKVDYQEVSSYFEYAVNDRFSAFVDVPFRDIDFDNLQEDNPESEAKRNPANAPARGSRFFPEPENGRVDAAPHTNFDGISDIQLGFKAALLADPDQYLTFQFRTFVPTGSAGRGLGTGHVSLEPGLLYFQRLTEQLTIQGQFMDWIPLDAGPGAGNILIYGLGVGYDVYHCGNLRITPITEFVGWTVLGGVESRFAPVVAAAPPGLDLPLTHGVNEADGDTIINAKVGVRTYFGRNDVYIGWGHSLTGEHWYKDIARVEYRLAF